MNAKNSNSSHELSRLAHRAARFALDRFCEESPLSHLTERWKSDWEATRARFKSSLGEYTDKILEETLKVPLVEWQITAIQEELESRKKAAPVERVPKNTVLVRTTQADPKVTDWGREAQRDHAQWGAYGRISDRSDAHGVCYRVDHEDGASVWYAPSELMLA